MRALTLLPVAQASVPSSQVQRHNRHQEGQLGQEAIAPAVGVIPPGRNRQTLRVPGTLLPVPSRWPGRPRLPRDAAHPTDSWTGRAHRHRHTGKHLPAVNRLHQRPVKQALPEKRCGGDSPQLTTAGAGRSTARRNTAIRTGVLTTDTSYPAPVPAPSAPPSAARPHPATAFCSLAALQPPI